MTDEKTLRHPLWMSGIPVTRQSVGTVEFTQTLPWVSTALGVAGLWMLLLAGCQWLGMPADWFRAFAVVVGTMTLLWGAWCVFILSQPPVVAFDVASGQLTVARGPHVMNADQIDRFCPGRGRCTDGEGGTYEVATLSLLSTAGGDSQPLYVTNRLQAFDRAWKAFVCGVRESGLASP